MFEEEEKRRKRGRGRKSLDITGPMNPNGRQGEFQQLKVEENLVQETNSKNSDLMIGLFCNILMHPTQKPWKDPEQTRRGDCKCN